MTYEAPRYNRRTMKVRKRSSQGPVALTAAVAVAHAAATAALANEAAAIDVCQPPAEGLAAPCPQQDPKHAHVEPSRTAIQPAAPLEPAAAPNVGRRFDELGPMGVGPAFVSRFHS